MRGIAMAPTRLRIGLLPALLLLLLAPARGADDEPVRVKARRLAAEFHEIRKSANWDEIKKRRDLIVEMGETESEGLLPVLFQAFQDDREQLCRIQAEIALGKRAPFPYLKRMVSTALTEKNDVFLMALPLALRHSRDERIGAWIVEWALPRLKPETARPAAIECLGLLHEASAREPLEKLLEKAHDVRILYETLIALARIAGPEAEGEILPFLTHEETLVRQGAVEALGEIDSPESTRRLLQVLTSVEPRVKEAAARALAARKHEAGIPALIDQLGPENGLRVRDTVRVLLNQL
jgi:HEAT repeat protein